MIQRGKFLKSSEYSQYNEMFKDSKVLSDQELKAGIEGFNNETNNIQRRMAVISTFEDSGELFDELTIRYLYYDENTQVLLMNLKNRNESRELIEKVWEYKEEHDLYHHQKFINHEIVFDEMVEDGYKQPEYIPEFESIDSENEESIIEPLAIGDAHTCTASGSCCQFEGVTYNHCGAYCGDHESSGGGDPIGDVGSPIHTVDRCCQQHDDCLFAGTTSSCTCHELLLNCLGSYSAPGDTIMGLGIRYKAHVIDGCPW